MAEDEIGVLKEIRDGLKQDYEWRRKVIEQSIEFQRKSVRLQRMGLMVVGVLIIAGVAALLFLRS